jgi:hypothetical protein
MMFLPTNLSDVIGSTTGNPTGDGLNYLFPADAFPFPKGPADSRFSSRRSILDLTSYPWSAARPFLILFLCRLRLPC